jgi:hypothetical protein
MATLRNLAVSLLYPSGVTEITRTPQPISRNPNRMPDYLPLGDRISNDFGDPLAP